MLLRFPDLARNVRVGHSWAEHGSARIQGRAMGSYVPDLFFAAARAEHWGLGAILRVQ